MPNIKFQKPETIMQINNRILDDLTRVTNSALGTMTGVKGEVDAMIRQQFEKILLNMDLVTRKNMMSFMMLRSVLLNALMRSKPRSPIWKSALMPLNRPRNRLPSAAPPRQRRKLRQKPQRKKTPDRRQIG
jgi:BMFP domain-containing protein YqiC